MPHLSANALRVEISERNLARATQHPHELTSGAAPSVLYSPSEPAVDGLCAPATHGNFLPASYRRILAHPDWSARLQKSYTGAARIPRRHDRSHRSELACAGSSDALLMNVFCYPGLLRRPAVLRLLGLTPGLRPRFGVRAGIPVAGTLPDRTELDLVVGDLILESKLTETGFGQARPSLVTRYQDLAEVFHLDELPRSATNAASRSAASRSAASRSAASRSAASRPVTRPATSSATRPASGHFAGYQLLRSVLAAHTTGRRFALLADARRPDLHEAFFQILRAVRSADLRARLLLLTWQELAHTLPREPQHFLATKYGIHPATPTNSFQPSS